jgi:ATP-dependent RNA helicase DeaD
MLVILTLALATTTEAIVVKEVEETEIEEAVMATEETEVTEVIEERERKDHEERDPSKTRSRNGNMNFERFFVNLGQKDSLNAQRLMGFINEQPSLEGVGIGRIEVLKTFSFVEVDTNYTNDVLKSMNGKDFRGRSCNIEVAGNKENPGKSKSKDKRSREGSRRY